MGKYEDMKKLFDSHEDKEKAVSMANYMKNQFDFYGIATPERKELYKEFIKSLNFPTSRVGEYA